MTANTLSRIAALAAVVLLSLWVPAAAADEYFVNEDDARRLAAVTFLQHLADETPFLEEFNEATLGSPMLIDDPETGPLFWEFPAERDGEGIGRLLIPADRRVGTTDFLIERCFGYVPWPEAFERAVESLHEEYGEIEILDARPVMYAFPGNAVEILFQAAGSDRPVTAYRDRWTAETVDPSQLRSFFFRVQSGDMQGRMCSWDDENNLKVEYGAALAEYGVEPEIVFEHEFSRPERDIARETGEAVYGAVPTVKTVDVSNLVLVPAMVSYRSREATIQMIYAKDHACSVYSCSPLSQQLIQTDLVQLWGDISNPSKALKSFIRYTAFWNYSNSDYITASASHLKSEIDAGRLFIELISPRRSRMAVAYKLDATGLVVSTGFYDPLPLGSGKIGWETTYSNNVKLVTMDSYLTVKK